MLFEHERIRTFTCPQCREVLATTRTTCSRCGLSISGDVARQVADLEDRMLSMEHDASHTKFLSWFGYLWYAGLVYLAWQGAVSFDSSDWYLQPHLRFYFYVAAALQPVFLAVIGMHILRWHSRYRGFWSLHARGRSAYLRVRFASLSLVGATLMYVVMALVPALAMWLRLGPLKHAP